MQVIPEQASRFMYGNSKSKPNITCQWANGADVSNDILALDYSI